MRLRGEMMTGKPKDLKSKKKATKATPKKRDLTAQRIVKAIRDSHGFISIAARKAGLHRATIHKYIHDYPSVREAIEEAKAATLDMAEGKLFELIEAGNTTAIIFYLKTQGKDRGYTERQEVGRGGPVTIRVVRDDESPKAIERPSRRSL